MRFDIQTSPGYSETVLLMKPTKKILICGSLSTVLSPTNVK
jgi:hypothetical protein